MLDAKGNLVTTSKALENSTVEMYSARLKFHTIKSNLKMHQLQRERLCESRIREAQNNITPDWTSDNKSRDPLGFANEVFKPENAGVDLKLALLKMSNKIKKEQVFPESLGMCNISSLYKNKGSRK